jgi:deazaflavin-dependent oxidoreductase (nitroreductase family)
MAEEPFLPPPWMAAHVGNRMATLFGRRFISRLTVVGRSSGKPRRTPVAVLDYEGERYLIAPRGKTHWARNLRAAGGGELKQGGRTWRFTAVEVPVERRPDLIAAYRQRFDRFPMVAKTFEELPDAADHPTFLLTRIG